MSDPWLDIVGIGEDGLAGLSPVARKAVDSAEVILGGARHHALTEGVAAERIAWPTPFDALIERLTALRGRRVVVLATGDPLWFSVGARIGRSLPVDEIRYHPQLSAFQLACARLGWSLADIETLTLHGRPVDQLRPHVQPGARLLILTSGSETPGAVAAVLREAGFGESPMSVLAHMGGPDEARIDGCASAWDHAVPAFHVLAVECRADPGAAILSRMPGLDDAMFVHDGTMTKQEVRALTICKLMPMRGALLWDIGSGCGSVAVEWMRAAPDARAIGIEPRADRREMAAANARALGVPRLELIAGEAPDALDGLEAPDAVFVGGGLSAAVFDLAWGRLKRFGRFVVNAVTLESEARLVDLHARHGGQLIRLEATRAEPIGRYRGWRPAMPVIQWSLLKR